MRSTSPSERHPLVPVIRSTIFSNVPGIVHGVSTRHGGVSPEPFGLNLSFNVGDMQENVEENRNRFFRALGVPNDALAIPHQEHTDTIRTINRPGIYEKCDALVTSECGVYCSVTIADCAPVFLFDLKRRVVACVHAGWRGTQKRIVLKAVELMKVQYHSNPADILAYGGPCAGPCCYEVGPEVAEQFDASYRSTRGEQTFLDIKKANADQLQAAGIPDSQMEVLPDCTICSPQYHSFRRDRDKSGRMVAVIGMTHHTR